MIVIVSATLLFSNPECLHSCSVTLEKKTYPKKTILTVSFLGDLNGSLGGPKMTLSDTFPLGWETCSCSIPCSCPPPNRQLKVESSLLTFHFLESLFHHILVLFFFGCVFPKMLKEIKGPFARWKRWWDLSPSFCTTPAFGSYWQQKREPEKHLSTATEWPSGCLQFRDGSSVEWLGYKWETMAGWTLISLTLTIFTPLDFVF